MSCIQLDDTLRYELQILRRQNPLPKVGDRWTDDHKYVCTLTFEVFSKKREPSASLPPVIK
jgi:hypothetical protein